MRPLKKSIKLGTKIATTFLAACVRSFFQKKMQKKN